jgi:hypothetical protein
MNCPSIEAQLVWVQGFQDWRSDNLFRQTMSPISSENLKPIWAQFMIDATRVVQSAFREGHSFGQDENCSEVVE